MSAFTEFSPVEQMLPDTTTQLGGKPASVLHWHTLLSGFSL
jgi:hypothetical protein